MEYGRQKLAGEEAVREALPGALVVRTSLIYGGAEPSHHERVVLGELGRRSASSPMSSAARRTWATWRPPCSSSPSRTTRGSCTWPAPTASAGTSSPASSWPLRAAIPMPSESGLAAEHPDPRPLDCRLDSSRARARLSTRLRGAREVLGGAALGCARPARSHLERQLAEDAHAARRRAARAVPAGPRLPAGDEERAGRLPRARAGRRRLQGGRTTAPGAGQASRCSRPRKRRSRTSARDSRASRRDDEARWIEADVDGVRAVSVYVPNGQAIGAPAFADKLRFLEAIAERVPELLADERPVVVAGDFNVCRDGPRRLRPGRVRGRHARDR